MFVVPEDAVDGAAPGLGPEPLVAGEERMYGREGSSAHHQMDAALAAL